MCYTVNEKDVALYARVSTQKQAENLTRQHERLIEACRERGHRIVLDCSEIASGLNDNRRQFFKIIDAACKGEVKRVVVEHRDRLTRVVDRFFPSSRLCPMCGTVKSDLMLEDRVFVCGCGYVEDRDLNAARNVETEMLRIVGRRSGFTETLNAQGQEVRPRMGRSWMNCEKLGEERHPAKPAV